MSDRATFEAWAKDRGQAIDRDGGGGDGYYWPSVHNAWVGWQAAWTASRAQALEEAAAGCDAVLDTKEEARADLASRDAKGTPDELTRLHHWATVSTFNAGVRRCVAAIRALGSHQGKGEPG